MTRLTRTKRSYKAIKAFPFISLIILILLKQIPLLHIFPQHLFYVTGQLQEALADTVLGSRCSHLGQGHSTEVEMNVRQL